MNIRMRQETTGRRKPFCFALCALLLALGLSAEAQEPKKVPRIGVLWPFLPTVGPPLAEAFRQGLRNLGYVEGQNITIEYRYSEGKDSRLPDLAGELLRLKVDVIFAPTTTAALVAKNATSEIPIITATAADPVGSGLAASLARPGGNVTGLSLLAGLEISGKELELLKEALPKLTRVAVLADPSSQPTAGLLKEAEQAARSLKVQLRVVEARGPNELEGAFSTIKKEHAGALLVIASPFIGSNPRIVSFAASGRLPAMYPYTESVDAGGLMSYGPNRPDLFRRAAVYVDKILKGTKPAALPIEQPMKFEFVINLKTAKQLGLTIPQSVLYRADRVIK
jgi:putative tryptophan/tyrosine transport system substrate-binding protein